MRILKRHIEMGEKSFDVAIDRSIVADVFERFPNQLELMVNMRDKKYDDTESETESETKTDIVELAKTKRLKDLIVYEDNAREIVIFALPMLLEKAKENDPVSMAHDILNYVEENEVDEFYTAIWEFILSGFTTNGRDKEQKVSFVMK